MIRLLTRSKPAACLCLIVGLALSHPGSGLAAEPGGTARHWAFQSPQAVPVPRVKGSARVRTPVDAFILARLESRQLTFSPEAGRAALLRRAFLDLTGLPPSPEEAEAFLTDTRPDAYERLVDRLLASPHFGERWGRHWLDGAGHVDVIASDNDYDIISLGEGKWRFRDYVVRAFNQDKPFDRFLVEQFAGDELVDWRAAAQFTPELQELLVATSFLRTVPDDTDAPENLVPDMFHAVLGRTAEVALNNVLALTLNCARCHDHKYEPVTQREYYQLLAHFSPAFDPQRWLQPKQRELPNVSAPDKAAMEKHNAPFEKQMAEIKERQGTVRRPYDDRLLDAKLLALPEVLRDDARAAIRLPYAKRNPIQRYLVEKFGSLIRVKPDEVTAALNDTDRAALAQLDREHAALDRQRQVWGTLHAVYDAGAPHPFHLLRRGDPHAPGAEVPPGFLGILPASDRTRPALQPVGKTSGRRLALAQWLTDADAPAGGLVARVLVNRAWQQLFGRGLVETADNFGLSGQRPSHPELLDWLTVEFLRGEWRMKPLLRLLLTSSVYRQSAESGNSSLARAAAQTDPDNQFLWRQRLRRLESEVVRDSILAVSGRLNRAAGGPSVPVESRADGYAVVKLPASAAASEAWRRSLYLLARRNYHATLLDAFDQPALQVGCVRRSTSAVVGQSLTMLNDAFVLEQAGAFAERVAGTASSEAGQVASAFQLALARPPTAQEAAWSEALLRRQRERFLAEPKLAERAAHHALIQLCHTLLNTSEFLYAP